MSNKFKIGDRVKFHGVRNGSMSHHGQNKGLVGKLATVKVVGRTSIDVEFDHDNTGSLGRGWFPERFALVPAAPAKPVSKFKRGDKVRVIAEYGHTLPVGHEAEVLGVEFDETEGVHWVRVKDIRGFEGGFAEHRFELIPPVKRMFSFMDVSNSLIAAPFRRTVEEVEEFLVKTGRNGQRVQIVEVLAVRAVELVIERKLSEVL